MQVLLLKDVDRLGKMGEVVKVRDGYAANFLIPRKLARMVTRKSAKLLEDEKKRAALRLKRLKVSAEGIKKRLENMSCTIPMQAGDDEKLFGSVTPEMIRNAYSQEGIEIDKKDITIEERINKLGVYNISVKLHPEVTANAKVWVVKR